MSDLESQGSFTGTYAASFDVTPNKTPSVPEPATLSLFAAGLAAAAIAARRRRKAS